MQYNGKCVKCGQERVEGSTLCLNCLCACVAERKDLERENRTLQDTLTLTRRILSVVEKKRSILQKLTNTNKREG